MKVIFITLDGLHPGFLGCYGNEWIETPTLDRWAADGVVFDQHIADQPDAAGARRAWRTGYFRFSEQTTHDLTRDLRACDVETALVTDPRTKPEYSNGWTTVHKAEDVEAVVKSATKVIRSLSKVKNWFLWIDFAAPIPPWEFHSDAVELYFDPNETSVEDDLEEDASTLWTGELPDEVLPTNDALFLRLQRTFAAAVSTLDAGLKALEEFLAKRGLLDEVMLIVTSSHGLPLGEHSQTGSHLHALHTELVHVPLIVRFPGRSEAGRRVGALTQPVDLMPTIRECFGLPALASDGCSLLPLARGAEEGVRSFAVSGWQKPDATYWAIRTQTRACLMSHPKIGERVAQLYVKPDDRWEVNDVVQHFSDDVTEMESTLQALIETKRPR